jgi:hypothetical protein
MQTASEHIIAVRALLDTSRGRLLRGVSYGSSARTMDCIAIRN